MLTPAAGAVVLLPFPFSDLSRSKLRPALVLADAGRGDFIPCQITSRPYDDARSIPLTAADFAHGSLRLDSFARPGKLFTAHATLMTSQVGALRHEALGAVVRSLVAMLDGDGSLTTRTQP